LPENRQARSSRQASFFAFEDLQIRNLVKNHHLAKSINDAAWGRFLWWVQYSAAMQAVPCLAVPPQFTSQDGSGRLPDGSRCPERVATSRSRRTHVCPRCGLVMDRDEYSGRLIKERALHLLPLNAGDRGERAARLNQASAGCSPAECQSCTYRSA